MDPLAELRAWRIERRTWHRRMVAGLLAMFILLSAALAAGFGWL